MSKPVPVTTMFARRVSARSQAQYEHWLTGIARASARFEGNLGMTTLRPDAGRREYITLTHFDSAPHLAAWMNSEERQLWLDRLTSVSVECERVDSLAGMETWFTLSGSPAPPRYKTAIMVLLGLYPTVLLLGYVLTPVLAGLPPPLRQLLSLSASVASMVWVVLPALTRLFRGWLQA